MLCRYFLQGFYAIDTKLRLGGLSYLMFVRLVRLDLWMRLVTP